MIDLGSTHHHVETSSCSLSLSLTLSLSFFRFLQSGLAKNMSQPGQYEYMSADELVRNRTW